jgi:hypothetical protein
MAMALPHAIKKNGPFRGQISRGYEWWAIRKGKFRIPFRQPERPCEVTLFVEESEGHT